MSQDVGKPYLRADGRAKVTGEARYSYEWPAAGVAHGVLVTSNVARGRIVGIDAAAAAAEPGVIAVITPFNAMRLPGGAAPADRGDRVVQVLQDDRILYSNQPVAVAVADTFERALHAALLVGVRAEAAPATVRMEDELANAFPHDIQNASGGQPADQLRGDVDQALRGAEHRLEALYETPPETHNPMEPHATLAAWSGDRLTAYDATQGIFGVRKKLAHAFAVPLENVRVITKFVGGGFGCKGSAWSHVVIAALAARQLGRPVKIALTRPQMFGMVGGRPHTRQKLAAAATRDGRLIALRHESTSTTSRFDDFLEPAALVSRHQYRCDNVETKHRLVRLDIGTPTYMRAPGESSGSFALESAIDELAHELGIDPLEFRLKNYAEIDPTEGKPFSSKSLRRCYQMGAQRFGWEKRNRTPRSAVRDGMLVGMGMATASYPANFTRASALARMNPDGSVLVQSGAVDIGGGTSTVMAQVAAETLGVPYEKVKFDLGDTQMPEAPRSGGSITAASVASAVEAACRNLKQKLAAAGGRLTAPVEARGEVAPSEERKKFSLHSFGADFAEVEVDPELGMVRVVRLVGAFAAGRILNARLARSQFMGGMVWGIGMALHEHSVYDQKLGRIMTRDLADYHVPSHKDVVEVDPLFIPVEEDAHVDPAGVKGIGEIGITGVAAAVANAVFNATGKRVRSLPITPDKLL
ncbi:MAG TPA: xanthine dehydrogenase family protein molybdopterin-binding subunit [Myxococcales bacterium]|nr:xanthine dehydrogenase family protein molybdopterin-binding subunit [Myxococcales bacterium]